MSQLYKQKFSGERYLYPESLYKDAKLDYIESKLLNPHLDYLQGKGLITTIKRLTHSGPVYFDVEITSLGIDKVEEIQKKSLKNLINNTTIYKSHKDTINGILNQLDNLKKSVEFIEFITNHYSMINVIIIPIISHVFHILPNLH